MQIIANWARSDKAAASTPRHRGVGASMKKQPPDGRQNRPADELEATGKLLKKVV